MNVPETSLREQRILMLDKILYENMPDYFEVFIFCSYVCNSRSNKTNIM